MALLNEDFLRAQVPFQKSIQESARDLNRGAIKTFGIDDEYDIFLSHSYLDAKVIEGLKKLLEKQGLKVYVDWMENPELDRSRVTPATAIILREAMKRSQSLLYAVSKNATQSKWTPWELGFSDALHGQVAIAPITQGSNRETSFEGVEYLGLYPYLDSDSLASSSWSSPTLHVNRASQLSIKSSHSRVGFSRWLQGVKP